MVGAFLSSRNWELRRKYIIDIQNKNKFAIMESFVSTFEEKDGNVALVLFVFPDKFRLFSYYFQLFNKNSNHSKRTVSLNSF